MTTTYQVDLTLTELEEVERALMVYQNHIRQYDEEIRSEAQQNVNTIISKLNKA